MKLWGIVRKDGRIMRQAAADYGNLSPKEADWSELIGPLCHDLDLSRPMILSKHLREIRDFSRVVFLPEDFVESVGFDKFEIEIYRKKNK